MTRKVENSTDEAEHEKDDTGDATWPLGLRSSGKSIRKYNSGSLGLRVGAGDCLS